MKSGDAGTVRANLSEPSRQRYVSGNDPASPSKDGFVLPALLVKAKLGDVRLVSNTLNFYHKERSRYDYTLYDVWAFALGSDPAEFYAKPPPQPPTDEEHRRGSLTLTARRLAASARTQ